ncbi:tripartite motif-containing protein 5-like [Mya arenaria]|uniref:tripartite motif-containing protein 5-like n=1 Tax=Mya arenaria TaxID=6604 RepID=UPI0022DEAAA3|nr:tripartite motif-containing protein 5-like [Mya arenaria]
MERHIRPPRRDPTTSDLEAPSPTFSNSSGSSQKPDFRSSVVETPRVFSATSGSYNSLQFRADLDVTVDSHITETLVCPICLGSMNTPKTLPCLHNACKKCLQQHILTHLKQELQLELNPTTFPCPVCERETQPPEKNVGIEKWASLFPTNYFLHAYCMILAVQREDVDCDPCLRRGETTLATWWCRECSEYQCNVCKTVHGGFKIFKDHDVLSVKEIAKNPHFAIPRYEPCHFHKEKITHFCRDHRVPCCSQCLVTSHRKCDHVVTVETEFLALKGRGGYTNLAELLTKYEDMVSELIDSRKNVIDDLESKRRLIIDHVQTVREGFENELRRLENKLLDDFDRFHIQEMNKLQALTLDCENLGKQITNAVNLVETVQHSGNEANMINLVENVSKECRTYEKRLRENQSHFEHVDYEFQVDQAIENVLKTAKSFGNINVKRSKKKSENIVSGARIVRNIAKEMPRFRVWIAGDRGRCGISGGVYFDDGRILLADHDNFKLKLFGTEGRLLCKLVLKSKPSDIALVDPDKFIATLPNASAVQFITMKGNQLTEGDFVNTKRMYHSVACANANIYLLGAVGIAVCSKESCAEMNFIKTKFQSPAFIQASTSGFVVTDRDKNAVNFFALGGCLLHRYTSKDMICPSGIDFDSQGHAFVCCKQSSNIHQLNEDGQRVKVILSERNSIEQPEIIKFQKFGNKFFVSESKISSRDFIRIFKWM